MDAYYEVIFGEKKKKTLGAGGMSGWAKNGASGYNGAILMGVCRGKISEGMDFSDNAARCVIMVGIPYPQITDPKVILKKHYLDDRCKVIREGVQNLSGKDWYNQ